MAVSGTRGDVQPAVVLGAELAERGHHVMMAVPPNLVDLARRAGLESVPFGYDTREHMNSDLVRHGLSRGSVVDRARALAELWNFGWDQMVTELRDVVETTAPDVLLTGITTEQIALPLAEARGIGLVALHHAPVRSNAQYSPVPGTDGAPSVVIGLAWTVLDHVLWAATRWRENALRRSLGISTVSSPLPGRIARRGSVEIQAYDRVLCPELAADWDGTRPLTGFLDVSPELRVRMDPQPSDPSLEAWIDDGTPPVYVGFGSMPVTNPAAVVAAVADAAARVGERVLLCAGWNDVDSAGPLGDHVRVTGAVDHAAVFPRCRAVVHHGGAGTTAAGLRAGRPTVVCSVSSDQPFWGRRVVALSCGAAMAASDITAESLEKALRLALEPAAAAGAAAVAAAMTSPEEAVRRAADLVESARRAPKDAVLRAPKDAVVA
ncbi:MULTISPECIES: glycosyltransferase [unclassified Rhodococcus (in: high G+C Gram-positive bacteria)]|nr:MULTISPECIES: glycosyltransferase [unclassified Rhodococcus (in: high G+C Gram-positive bacteria)]MBY6606092.1 glycosyltransferase family 1 protein [Rhodococcus sp. BP-361]MBY6610430.1 glycosyltransferase family 1 protein [Rhodococcus sp. BP-360]MBY6625089.1 glycosyltransferase family 1 protein [Rhodococcus sp. BP-350]